MKENAPRSGSGGESTKSPWPLYDDLLFLLPTLKIIPGSDSLDLDSQQDSTSLVSGEGSAVDDDDNMSSVSSFRTLNTWMAQREMVCLVSVFSLW